MPEATQGVSVIHIALMFSVASITADSCETQLKNLHCMCYTKKFRTAKVVMALDYMYYMYLAVQFAVAV